MTRNPIALPPPVTLSVEHDLANFNSGEGLLDSWLRERALNNMEMAASRTYVICPKDSLSVVGYYALCMGQILNQETVGSMRQNMPGQIPAVVLGRLAVDQQWQGKGLGKALLQDAVQRSIRAAKEVSAILLIVHSISQVATEFYLHHGFVRLPLETPTFALDLIKLTRFVEAC